MFTAPLASGNDIRVFGCLQHKTPKHRNLNLYLYLYSVDKCNILRDQSFIVVRKFAEHSDDKRFRVFGVEKICIVAFRIMTTQSRRRFTIFQRNLLPQFSRKIQDIMTSQLRRPQRQLSYSEEQSRSWEANSSSGIQEPSRILWNPSSLPCLQECTNCPHPLPDQSSPPSSILYL
jgi:hypothetical protein